MKTTLNPYTASLHTISSNLHELSIRRKLTKTEVEVYLTANKALNPLLSDTSILSYLGKGGKRHHTMIEKILGRRV